MEKSSTPEDLETVRVISLDKLGISLSFICAIHCMITPLIMLSIPIMARYYLAQPWFHWILALFIVPVGLWAFISGYLQHQKKMVLFLGLPGLVIVGVIPVFFHDYFAWFHFWWAESAFMIVGSVFLISAHWVNRNACNHELHNHHGPHRHHS
jgi:hypothetical protein